jgi:serine/threonine protein kinase
MTPHGDNPVLASDDADRTLIRMRPLPFSVPPKATDTRTNTGGATGTGPKLPALRTGSIINERFVLEEIIGRGGMGTVFRARDMRKEEAQDRNPYVAIKVLNEDFRDHPGALQALQREARKAQLLAHPNIVTVYDFDRDGPHVYLVMELLEGEPLDRLIKRMKDVGLEVKEAVRIMRGICRAMDHAHELGILHADFKPANVFLTRSGIAKVLDFGIAHAVTHKDLTDADNLTRFDPGTFAALTPTYAGCEVLEGQSPDRRDDIYAIACVTYELITGSHPYNRLSATQAEKARMTPDAPAGMSTLAWRALRRGLSVRREGRPASATALLDALAPFRQPRVLYPVIGTLTTVAALALVSLHQLDKQHELRMVASLASADARRIEPILPELRTLQPTRRASLLLHDEARAGLIQYYSKRVEALVDSSRRHADLPSAARLVRELEGLLPDSQAVHDIRDRLASRRSEPVLPAASPGPPAVGVADAAAAREPSAAQTESQMLLEAGLARATLTLAQARSLAQQLEQRGSADPSVEVLRHKLQGRLIHSAQLIQSKRGLDAALAFMKGAFALFPESKELSQTLTGLLAAVAQRDTEQKEQLISQARHEIETLIANPTLDEAWLGSLQQQLGELARYSPETDAYVNDARKRVAVDYLAGASGARRARQIQLAAQLLEHARQYDSTSPDLTTEEALLSDARAQQELGGDKSKRAAYLNELKHKLIAQLQANDVTAAQMSLRILEVNLAADDRFLTRVAPRELAAAYARMAAKTLADGRLKDAVEIVNRGRLALPAVQGLAKTQALYTRYQELDEYLTGGPVPDVHRVRGEISDLYSQDSDTATVAVPILAKDLQTRLHGTRDPELARRLAQAGSEIFGSGPPFRRD